MGNSIAFYLYALPAPLVKTWVVPAVLSPGKSSVLQLILPQQDDPEKAIEKAEVNLAGELS